jgi:flagellar hook assembly protein FlgD
VGRNLKFHRNGSPMKELVPPEFRLSQNYPNPFSEHTTIKLCVPYRTKVTLQVLNPEGKMVRTLIDEEKEAGTYEIGLSVGGESASGDDAATLPEGVYVYQMRASNFSATKQMSLLKRKTSSFVSPCSRDDVHNP